MSMPTVFGPFHRLLSRVRSRTNSLDEPSTPSLNSDKDEKEKVNELEKLPVLKNKDNGTENAADKRERLIREKLTRFARVPVSAVFEFVSIPLSFYTQLTLGTH